MLKEMQFVEVDKVEVAMNRLRLHEAEALRRDPKGYYVAFPAARIPASCSTFAAERA